jgi:Fe-S-cluster-containing dehydrogenase component
MAKIAMAVDLDMCTGCFACQNACKMVNALEPGVKWLKVLPVDCQPEEVHGALYMDRFPVPTTLHACLACPDRCLAQGVEVSAADNGTQPLCARSCMGEALQIGDPEAISQWADGKRSVVYTL